MISFATGSNDPNTRLGWGERLSYGMGNFGMAWVNGMMSAFLMKYLTDVSLVDAGVVSLIIALSKIFDGISDLIMGRIVDKTHSRIGKARVWLIRMALPLAVSTVLLFSIPSGMKGFISYVYVFIVYNLVNTVCYTAMFVPYNSLISLSTNDMHEHGMLGNLGMIFQTIANIAMNTFFMAMVVRFSGAAQPYMAEAQKGWTMAAIVVGIIIVISSLLCVFGTKERTSDEALSSSGREEEGGKSEDIPLGKALRSLFTNKYWLFMIFAMFVIFFIIVLYSADVLGDYSLYTPVNNALSIAQFAIMFATPFFMVKFGKHKTYLAGLLIMTAGFLGTGFAGTNVTLLVAFNALKGIGLGAAGGMAFGMVADTLEYGEWKDGFKAVGMGNAAISAAQKLGLGLGQVALGLILAFGGYVNGSTTGQPESAKQAISFLYNWLPAIMLAAAIIIMLFYNLDKKLPKMHEEIEARRHG